LIRFLHAYFPGRTLLLGISEGCLVALAFLAATIVRLGTNDATLVLSYEQGFVKIVLVSAVFITCMYYFDLYDSSILNNPREVLTRIIQMQGTVCIFLAGFYYMYPALELARGIFLIGFSLVGMLLLLWRRLFSSLNTLPQFAERALIFGDSPLATALATELKTHPEDLGKVIGRQGRTAKAIRTLLGAAGVKLHKRFTLEILDED